MSCGCGGNVKVSTKGAKGDPGSCIPIVQILYADLVTLQSNSQLVPATIYFITDKNVYLQALTTTGLDSTGVVKAINADYNNVTGSFIGVWTGTTQLYYNNLIGSFTVGEIVTGGTSGAQGEIILKIAVNNLGYRIAQVISKNGIAFSAAETITGASSGATGTLSTITTTSILGTIAINKIVSWNNLHYKNSTGSASIIHPKYDTTNWTALATTDASYQIEYDKITYNFSTATITGREDKRGNVVIDKSTTPNSIDKFQWGRDGTFGNNIFSFGFEGWNAATAQTNLFVQDGGYYVGDTAATSFTNSAGRSTVVLIGTGDCLAAKVFHGSSLVLTAGNARHAYVENFGDVTVYSSSAAAADSIFTNASCILTGTSIISGCNINGGATLITKNFASESFSNKVYYRDVQSTFNVSLSQAFGLTTLTLDSSLFYGIYNTTITGGTAAIDTIANMPSIMPVQINSVTTNTLGIVNGGAGSILLKGRTNKSLMPANKDWIIFQNISAGLQEVNSSLSSALSVANTLFVSKSGNDTTGTTGRFDLPYLTITAAQTAASSGQTIIIYPGTYSESGLGKAGINYSFIDGAILAATTSTGFINNGSISYSITGDGELTTTTASVIDIANAGTISVKAKKLSSISGFTVTARSTSIIYLDVKESITATTGRCFQLYDTAAVYCKVPIISITTGYAVGSSAYAGTTLHLNSNKISSAGDTVFDLGGNANIYGDIVYTGFTDGFTATAAVACVQNFYGNITANSTTSLMNYAAATTGTINFYGRIVTTGVITVNGSIATFTFYNEISTNNTVINCISQTSGTVKVLSRLTNLSADATSYGIIKTTGTLILQNAIIVTGAGSAPSVYSAAAQNYKVLGTLSCNIAPSVNLTDLCGGVIQVDTDVQ